MTNGQKMKQGYLCLDEATQGWTALGLAITLSADIHSGSPTAISLLDKEIKTVAKIWEAEDVPVLPPATFTLKEVACVIHYEMTATYGQMDVLKFDYQLSKMKPFFVLSSDWLPNIGSDNFWPMKKTFTELRCPNSLYRILAMVETIILRRQ